MSDTLGEKHPKGESLEQTNFVIINEDCDSRLRKPTSGNIRRPIPVQQCEDHFNDDPMDSGIFDSFGKVSPILSSGEWSEKEFIINAPKKFPLWKRVLTFLYG